MNSAPIYLLVDGEADGPHEAEEIADKIDSRKLKKSTLAAIEGMKDWRSVMEVLTWSYGRLLADEREAVMRLSTSLMEARIGLPSARAELATLIGRRFDASANDSFGIILEANAELLRNYKQWPITTDPGSLDLYPALELVKFSELNFPRDWKMAWQQAGGQVRKNKMIALKSDPVWGRLSDFGFPFPPFSLDTAMWVEEINREDALSAGLEATGQQSNSSKLNPYTLIGIL